MKKAFLFFVFLVQSVPVTAQTCDLTIKTSPSFRGLRLGMNIGEVAKSFPIEKQETSEPETKQATVRFEDVKYELTFVKDLLFSIDANYYLDEDFSDIDKFTATLNKYLKLPNYWKPSGNNRVLECRDFSIITALPETFMPKVSIKVLPPKPPEKPKRIFKP